MPVSLASDLVAFIDCVSTTSAPIELPVTRGLVLRPIPLVPLAISEIPYNPLPGTVEKATMKIAYVQFKLKNLLLLLLHSFLCGKGPASPTDVDIHIQVILSIIKIQRIL